MPYVVNLQSRGILTCKFKSVPTLLFLKMGQPRPLFHLFRLFKNTLKFLQLIIVKKCPTNIRCQDSNSRPLEHESPPITTRPGLPPFVSTLLAFTKNDM